uniref:Uncharacterized protein n=1 Tax=Ciona intestinalis TaxID=7719 RepID=H2Y3T7_CIOIN
MAKLFAQHLIELCWKFYLRSKNRILTKFEQPHEVNYCYVIVHSLSKQSCSHFMSLVYNRRCVNMAADFITP